MAADLFLVINTGDPVAPARRRRQWLSVGEALVIAGTIVRPVNHGDELPDLEIADQATGACGAAPLMPLSFSTPYRLIPRAVRCSHTGTVTAVLLETQYTGSDKPGWETQNEDDCNATPNLQSIPDKQ